MRGSSPVLGGSGGALIGPAVRQTDGQAASGPRDYSGRVEVTERARLPPEIHVDPAGKQFHAAHGQMLALLHLGGQSGWPRIGPPGADCSLSGPPVDL